VLTLTGSHRGLDPVSGPVHSLAAAPLTSLLTDLTRHQRRLSPAVCLPHHSFVVSALAALRRLHRKIPCCKARLAAFDTAFWIQYLRAASNEQACVTLHSVPTSLILTAAPSRQLPAAAAAPARLLLRLSAVHSIVYTLPQASLHVGPPEPRFSVTRGQRKLTPLQARSVPPPELLTATVASSANQARPKSICPLHLRAELEGAGALGQNVCHSMTGDVHGTLCFCPALRVPTMLRRAMAGHVALPTCSINTHNAFRLLASESRHRELPCQSGRAY
jgi:hypothetical protein